VLYSTSNAARDGRDTLAEQPRSFEINDEHFLRAESP
jgi:hypothetical protein